MRNLVLSALAVFLAACGGASSKPQPLIPRNVSAQDHLAESRREEDAAAGHEKQAHEQPAGESATSSLQCVDDPLESVSYSGGERYKVMRPCWTSHADSSSWHRQEEERHRKEAAKHRSMAEALIAAESTSCGGLGEAEISQSPLTRGNDILGVEPIRDGDKLLGANILLRKVPGLTVSWLQKSLACHRARAAALGYPATFMADCPMSLPSVSFKVSESKGGLIVEVRASRDEIAAAIVGRAQASKAAGK